MNLIHSICIFENWTIICCFNELLVNVTLLDTRNVNDRELLEQLLRFLVYNYTIFNVPWSSFKVQSMNFNTHIRLLYILIIKSTIFVNHKFFLNWIYELNIINWPLICFVDASDFLFHSDKETFWIHKTRNPMRRWSLII